MCFHGRSTRTSRKCLETDLIILGFTDRSDNFLIFEHLVKLKLTLKSGQTLTSLAGT
ncbi:hypothetical protein BofuT4_P059660.1 [Botrytis cinerea T4]|uniref:Uncharacterized protein n=1 Tax=Botryotinia fuckeliana (strain T4) TaxID=999810 RepID=G2XV66_BOTF4|nr:hypothetical protein BofuT4_P059660.1 [Botrytis cinerea T4]